MCRTFSCAIFLCLAMLYGGCDSRERTTDRGSPDSAAPEAAEPDHAPDNQAPTDEFALANRFPLKDDERIALVTEVTVAFTQPLLEESYDHSLLALRRNGTPVPGELQLVDSRTLQFSPNELLEPDTTYQVELTGEAMSQSGQRLEPERWQFRTVSDVHTTAQDIIDQCMAEVDIDMLAAVNRARASARNCGEDTLVAAGKLSWNCSLQAAALKHVQDMSSNNFFSHTGGDGSSIGDRALQAGYSYSYVGENIAAGQRNVADVMAGLLASPSHCRNIMSPSFVHFGSGVSTNDTSDYRRYWAQAFGRPR